MTVVLLVQRWGTPHAMYADILVQIPGAYLVCLTVPWVAAWVHYPQVGNLEAALTCGDRHCHMYSDRPGTTKQTTSKFAAALATDPILAAAFGDAKMTCTSCSCKAGQLLAFSTEAVEGCCCAV